MSGKKRIRPTPPEFIMRQLEEVPISFKNDAGDLVKELFTIRFKSFTLYGLLKLNEMLDGETFVNEEHLACAITAHSIETIIDSDGQPLTDEDGEPATLNAAFFAGLLDEDRKGLHAAIKADANPPKTSPAPGPSGSKPTASEG